MIDPHPAQLSPRFVPELDQTLTYVLRAAHAFRIHHYRSECHRIRDLLEELDHLCSHTLIVAARLERLPEP